MAATNSASAWTVFLWKPCTRVALSGTLRARCSFGSCVVTPTGHLLVLQRCAWMQPSANMNAACRVARVRAERELVAMPKAVTILPAGDDPASCRAGRRRRARCARSVSPSSSGKPMELENSQRRRPGTALAAVDGDEVRRDAGLHHRLADGEELARLADAELEADRLAAGELAQLRDERAAVPSGVENAWMRGREAVLPTSTWRISAISAVTFSPGRMPPCPGLAPCDSLISIILTCGLERVLREQVGIETRRSPCCGSRSSRCRSARSGRRRPSGDSGEIPPSPVLWAKPPILAPLFSARTALPLSAP